ncbi:respiratory nitrate reductase subunit gamma, partial [Flaviflexus sp.]
MEAVDIVLWAVIPYVSIFLFIVGMIWRWKYDQYGWTTRSSQSYESVWLKLASPLFHFGILFVAIGHFLGLMIPKSWTRTLGVSDTVYHWVATIPGTIAGLAAVVGLALLIIRRRTYGDVFRATTVNDKIMYIFLAVPIVLGLIATLINQVFTTSHGYDYRETISPWLRNLFIFNPQPELMVDVPISFQMHVIAG